MIRLDDMIKVNKYTGSYRYIILFTNGDIREQFLETHLRDINFKKLNSCFTNKICEIIDVTESTSLRIK